MRIQFEMINELSEKIDNLEEKRKYDLCFISHLKKDKKQLEQENKQLKEELENIKDFNNKLQASKDRLDKDDYNLAHILTELEEWLNENKNDNSYFRYTAFTDTLDKIQELKEKYK